MIIFGLRYWEAWNVYYSVPIQQKSPRVEDNYSVSMFAVEREERIHKKQEKQSLEVLEAGEFSKCNHGASVDERGLLGLRLDLFQLKV